MWQRLDPSVDIWRARSHPLNPIFLPRSVAVVGATEREGSVGRTVLWNLISHPFGGTVYPVNPKRHQVLGIRAYERLSALPEPVDLAIIAIPAAGVPKVVQECVEAGVKGAIVLSAGFKETGPAGWELEKQIQQTIQSRQRDGVLNPRHQPPLQKTWLSPRSGVCHAGGGSLSKTGDWHGAVDPPHPGGPLRRDPAPHRRGSLRKRGDAPPVSAAGVSVAPFSRGSRDPQGCSGFNLRSANPRHLLPLEIPRELKTVYRLAYRRIRREESWRLSPPLLGGGLGVRADSL
jgi:predicted CoA-binding protein